jgi:uncharacterized protein
MDDNRTNKIDYIEFHATDIATTKKFYEQVFGWQFTDYGPNYTSFADGRINGGFAKAPVTHGAGALVVVYVDDLKAAEQKVKTAGGKIVKEIFSFPGGSRFHFTDPSGNELSAWHRE